MVFGDLCRRLLRRCVFVPLLLLHRLPRPLRFVYVDVDVSLGVSGSGSDCLAGSFLMPVTLLR